MPKCLRCSGMGSETYDEDGRMVTDVCYHCAGSGQVELEVDLQDRLMVVAGRLAYQVECEYRKDCDNDPNGDGYDLGAAENMMSTHDYFQSRVSDRQYQIGDQLRNLPSIIQKILLEWHEKPKSDSEVPTLRFPSPNGGMAPVEQDKVQSFGDDDIPF